jgi:AcrB/AcrD/AcrF family
MTSLAMIAGMVPMALGVGEGGEQTAPLGRAVVGGLLASTCATLVVLPAVFAVVQRRANRGSVSLHPLDPESRHFRVATAADLLLAETEVASVVSNSSRTGAKG